MTDTKNMNQEQEEKLTLVKRYSAQHMPHLLYHNFGHAVDVANVAQNLSKLENLSAHQGFLLQTGAYLHDIIYDIHSKDNEERSALLAEDLLPTLEYGHQDIYQVKSIILATKIPTQPKSRLEEVMCDADVDNLGRPDFFEKGELLRQEMGVQDRKVWYANTLKFLQGHRYYTEAARDLRQKGFEENITNLRKLVERM